MNAVSAIRCARHLLALMPCVLAAAVAGAADVDLSAAPLFTATAVKPNIMFLMDDSDSMRRNWLPDRAVYWAYPYYYGQWSTHCNYMAYNPAYTYRPPVDANGAPLPDAALSSPQFYYVYTGKQKEMGFDFGPDGSVNVNDFYYECISQIGNAPGDAVFKRVEVAPSSVEAKNYANWQKYYGTRREMMKAAIKQVFSRLDANYRVGFSVTSDPSAVDHTSDPWWKRWSFLDVRDFDPSHKTAFFTAIDKSDGYFDTPLRGAVSKTGQYFARKAHQQTYDPVQRSCQRNFAILATDGGWTRAGEDPSGTRYGPYAVDNATVLGQQDTGTGVARPMRDAGADQVPTLADVAAYYYKTDLRHPVLGNCIGNLGRDVCKDDVPGRGGDAYQSGGDVLKTQHLTLFTLGLGLSGTIKYRPDYTIAREGDFHQIVTGAKDWPAIADPGSANDFMPLTHTDDMWHAAVNARGHHFAANDPGTVVSSLGSALDLIRASTGAGASASTSSLQPVEGENDVFLAQFTSQKWTGDLLAFKIDPVTGDVSSTKTWSAREQLDASSVTAEGRRILYRSPTAVPGDSPREFTAANLTADGLAEHFSGFCSKPGAGSASRPEQCGSLSGAKLAAADDATKLIAYLRGDQTLTDLYRARESRLGDIVNASPVFVGKPGFPYTDPTYVTYRSDHAGRTAVVLAAANDGMLHAFERASGRELWAYVPRFVMPDLRKLADTRYPNHHAYFVDGSPQVADIKVGGEWKTLVVGGLNGGGRGYYALDITDPGNPKVLWEFSDPDLGYTFGNPVVVSRASATKDWVVVFASGYNNVSPGDGRSHLFVVDAATGALQLKLATDASVASSGLAKLNVWVDDETENVARRFYGGDMQGNVWRFDIDDQLPPAGNEAILLATLKDDKGNVQPVTTRPVLAQVKFNGRAFAVVYVGTGRYLGLKDVADTSTQSLYAIKDELDSTGWGVLRIRADVVRQAVTVTTDASGRKGRAIDPEPVNWTSKSGWYLDLPTAGERITVDPSIALDRLYIAANIPETDTCQVGGSSYLYMLDIVNGGGYSTWETSTLVLGFTFAQRQGGSIDGYITGADGSLTHMPGSPPSSSSNLRRVSWREIVD